MLAVCGLDVRRGVFLSLSCPNPQPRSDCKKETRQAPTEEHSTECLSDIPQNYQGHQRQGQSEKLSQPGHRERRLGHHDKLI